MKFKTILQILCLCFLIVVTSCKNDTTEKTTSFLEGLTEVPKEEMQNLSYSIDDLTFYNDQGNILTSDKAEEYLSQGAFPKIYTNAEGKITVGVVAPPTEEEKAAFEKFMAEFEKQAAKLKETVGQPFPDFELVDYDGKEVKSDDLKGKITVVNFWFKECKPCILEMPELNELVEEYKDNSNVQFIGFSTTAKDRLPSFFEKHDFDYRIVPDSNMFASANNISSFPTNIIVDQEGNIAFIKTGYASGVVDTIKEGIENLL